MFAGLGSPTHLLLILVVILLLFGAKRLPEMGKSLGQGIKEFKQGINSKEEPPVEDERPEAIEEERARAKPAPGDKPQEEAATTKGSQSPERR